MCGYFGVTKKGISDTLSRSLSGIKRLSGSVIKKNDVGPLKGGKLGCKPLLAPTLTCSLGEHQKEKLGDNVRKLLDGSNTNILKPV